MKKRKVDSSATFLRRIQICFQNRKIPILKFWPPIGGPLVTPWPLTSVVESSPTLFWPSKSVRWKVRTLSLMYFLCMSQFQKKRLKLGPYLYSTRLSNDFPFSHCKCRPGYTLDKDGYHCKLDKDCDRVRVDVIFVLDSSNSLAGDDFSEELGVVREFIEFCKNVSRLSIIQFLQCLHEGLCIPTIRYQSHIMLCLLPDSTISYSGDSI